MFLPFAENAEHHFAFSQVVPVSGEALARLWLPELLLLFAVMGACTVGLSALLWNFAGKTHGHSPPYFAR